MDTNWTTLVLGVLSPVSALGGVCLTLWFQERRERSGAGVTLATELLASAEVYYFAIKRSANHVRDEERISAHLMPRAEKPIQREESKQASRRWAEARSRASVSIKSKEIRDKIDAVTEAIGRHERTYLWLEDQSVDRTSAWADYEKAARGAWDATEELRAALHKRLARRF